MRPFSPPTFPLDLYCSKSLGDGPFWNFKAPILSGGSDKFKSTLRFTIFHVQRVESSQAIEAKIIYLALRFEPKQNTNHLILRALENNKLS